MNDTTKPPADSPDGSELPEDDQTASADPTTAAQTDEPVTAPTVAPPPPARDAAALSQTSAPGSPWKRRLGLAGAAAGLVAAGGLGGFALGHATADDGRGDRFERMSFDRDWDGDGHYGHPGGRGHGQPPGFGPNSPPGQIQPNSIQPNSTQPNSTQPNSGTSDSSVEGSGSST